MRSLGLDRKAIVHGSPAYETKLLPVLREAASHPLHDWLALGANTSFKSDYVPRGHITELRMMENKEAVVRALADAGCQGVLPRSFVLPGAGVSERRDAERLRSLSKVCNFAWETNMTRWVRKPARGAFGMGVSLWDLSAVKRSATDKESFLTSCGAGPEADPSQDLLLQEFLSHPVGVAGKKVEIRAHVLVARDSPLLVFVDPNFVVKWATRTSADSERAWVVNSHAQKLDSLLWSEVATALEAELPAGAAAGVVAGVAAGIRRAVRAVVYAAGMSPKTQNPPRWEIYGADFALDWGDSARTRATPFLLDWNMRPGIGIACRCGLSATMPFVRDAFSIVVAIADALPLPETNLEVVVDEARGLGADVSDICR
mmetsp:Transcript_26289/g.59519  ORF Transcript_26289/g.59519 Transcript_26289/m.59519 type:complete len:373 (-) Transcript_26289:7-1125(-)